MRKFLYALAIASLVLSSNVVVKAESDAYFINREGIEMNETEYQNLLNLGFTTAQIDRMDYDTFIDNKDIEATLLSENTQYVKTTTTIRNGITTSVSQIVSELEYNTSQMQIALQPPVSPNANGTYYDGISEDYYRSMTSRIANINDLYMRYKVDLQWLNMPSTRSWDIMGIGIETAKVQVASGLMARQDWKTTGDTYGYSESYAEKVENTGGFVMFELPSGSMSILESYLYFNVAKKPNVGTLYAIGMVGDYAHATSNISDVDDAWNYVSVNYITGIEVDSPYHNSYDSMIESEAAFYGTW